MDTEISGSNESQQQDDKEADTEGVASIPSRKPYPLRQQKTTNKVTVLKSFMKYLLFFKKMLIRVKYKQKLWG